MTVALGAAALAGPAAAFSGGPPDGFAGNPPDYNDCTLCHYEHPVNSGDGNLELLGVPQVYTPGESYMLTVRLSDPGQQRWGFELTVLDSSDPGVFDEEGGMLVVTDPEHTRLSEDAVGTVDFLKQTLQGTYNGVSGGPVEWPLSWTAPEDPDGVVTFYLAGNAADGDGSFIGDWIYLLDRTVAAETPVPTDLATWGRIKGLFR